MDTKKSLVSAGVIVLLLAVGLVLVSKSNKNPSSQTKTPQQNSQTSQPKFVLGDVTKVEGSKVSFTQDGPKVAVVSESTVIEKQVKDKDGVSLVAVKLTEIKAGNRIAVFYTNDPVNGQYQATKIQVIK